MSAARSTGAQTASAATPLVVPGDYGGPTRRSPFPRQPGDPAAGWRVGAPATDQRGLPPHRPGLRRRLPQPGLHAHPRRRTCRPLRRHPTSRSAKPPGGHRHCDESRRAGQWRRLSRFPVRSDGPFVTRRRCRDHLLTARPGRPPPRMRRSALTRSDRRPDHRRRDEHVRLSTNTSAPEPRRSTPTDDTVDDGDGVTSLRDAIAHANGLVGALPTITLPRPMLALRRRPSPGMLVCILPQQHRHRHDRRPRACCDG